MTGGWPINSGRGVKVFQTAITLGLWIVGSKGSPVPSPRAPDDGPNVRNAVAPKPSPPLRPAKTVRNTTQSCSRNSLTSSEDSRHDRSLMVSIEGIDLNLFLVLHHVLSEGSVTRAAERLHVTPSAVSNSLARIRQLVGDPLLVKDGRTLVATPVPPITIQQLWHSRADSDPALTLLRTIIGDAGRNSPARLDVKRRPGHDRSRSVSSMRPQAARRSSRHRPRASD
jgi:Bacterial regulatory helix-turn-helix protein, lysR family